MVLVVRLHRLVRKGCSDKACFGLVTSSRNYTCEHYPERLQKLVENGDILTYLEEFDIKVTDAICDQTDLLMENNKEYQIAVETGNLVEVGSIGNMLRENAKEIVYEDMVYV